ncbi:MAG TPA: ATP-binding protein [Vicinamibacterales bacterium]|nr:ATP-binding protein [Vicinamibacterales bacterium]
MLSTLRRKLLWLIAARAAVVTLLLGSGTLIKSTSPATLPIDTNAFFAVIGITYALTVAYVLLLGRTERHRWLVDLQLGLDAVIVSAVVYLTGGINSYFSSLYTLPIIAATAIEPRRGGLMVSILSCVLYAGIVVAQYAGALGFEAPSGQPLPALKLALFTVGLNLFGFGAIAALTGYLAERLRQADIQLQLASDQIEDLQAFSRHIIDSLTSGLATTDIEGRILTFNRAAAAITGIAESDAVGASALDVLSLSPEFQALFSAHPEHPRLPRMDATFRRKDGRQIELGLSTALLFTPRGETGFLLTFQDVTDTRRRDREARVQQRLAAVGEMAAGIAHEIRNPLASMAGSIQILRHEVTLTPEQSQLMDIVLRESERLNETIKSFLAYARPQRQAMATVDVRRVITDTATLLENSPERSGAHRIAVEVPPSEVWLQVDEGQLRQIVWNLATNGLRAMPDGGRLTLAARARAHTAEAAGDIEMEVRDEGTGIAPEELDGIFQPFRAGFARGTGLGLSIVHRIVADYGGEIQVTSDRGTGTTVLVRMPATAGARSTAPVPEHVS